jgi:hypothetical protein
MCHRESRVSPVLLEICCISDGVLFNELVCVARLTLQLRSMGVFNIVLSRSRRYLTKK